MLIYSGSNGSTKATVRLTRQYSFAQGYSNSQAAHHDSTSQLMICMPSLSETQRSILPTRLPSCIFSSLDGMHLLRQMGVNVVLRKRTTMIMIRQLHLQLVDALRHPRVEGGYLPT